MYKSEYISFFKKVVSKLIKTNVNCFYMTRFVGIVSGKGGVGRTTIAINLSTALHKFNREVILVDAHLNQPHVALFHKV